MCHVLPPSPARWKEQREAMMNKLRDSTKAKDDEITRNLVGLARTRPDIFGEASALLLTQPTSNLSLVGLSRFDG